MSLGLPPSGSTPAEEWTNKVLQAVDGALGDAGATASTGGFVDAAPRESTGGLASSVNVKSIANEAKLNEHSEGMTKDDLLKGLSGREQAAAQLAAVHLNVAGSTASPHDMPIAKVSSGPVNATSQVSTAEIMGVPTVTPSSSTGLTRPISQKGEENPLSKGHASGLTVDERLSVEATKESETTGALLPKQDRASGCHPSVVVGQSGPSEGRAIQPQTMAPLRQEPQPKLPDLMPVRNVPVDTPMVEGIPGGWIGSLKASVPGSDREHPETTIYQDLVTGLDAVGQTTFNVIPQGLKDSINPNRSHPGPTVLDQAKAALDQVHLPELPSVHLPQLPQFGSQSHADSRSKAVVASGPEPHKVSIDRSITSSQTSPGDLLNQARNMAADLLSGTQSRAEEAYHAARKTMEQATGSAKGDGTPAHATTSRSTESMSLPSAEKHGQKPGDHTAGVGALPGNVGEEGVAILPAERQKDNDVSTKAVVATTPGLEQNASGGILSLSGEGQITEVAAKAERSAKSPLSETQQEQRASTSTFRNSEVGNNIVQRQSSESDAEQAIGTAGESPLGTLFAVHTTSSPVQESNSVYVDRNQVSEHSSPKRSMDSHVNNDAKTATAQVQGVPVSAVALAPPLGVFNNATPVAGSDKIVMPGEILPAKPETPIAVSPVHDSARDEPIIQNPAFDPIIAPSARAETTVPAVTSHGRSSIVDEPVPTHPYAPAGTAIQEPNSIPSPYPASAETSTDVRSPSLGKLDHPSADRMDSSASVTAVKHGHLGQQSGNVAGSSSSALDTVSEKALPIPPSQSSDEPNSRDFKAGSIPVERSEPVTAQASLTSPSVHKPTQVVSNSSGNLDSSHHQRTDSATSTSSKKKGFFSKLKDKMHHENK